MEKMGFKYETVAKAIRNDILQGTYPEGRLPVEKELAELHGVSLRTIRRAVEILQFQGMVNRVQGSGTYITRPVRLLDSKTVAILVANITSYISPTILSGIEKTLSAEGYSVQLYSVGNHIDREREILKELLEHPVAGIIVEAARSNLYNPNDDLYQELGNLGTVLVFLNDMPRGYTKSDCCYVIMDDYAGGQDAAKCLLRHGHSAIGGIFKADDQRGVRRYAGFADEVVKAGIQEFDSHVFWYTTGNRNSLFGEHSGALIQKMFEGCTAVVCYNDQIASSLLAYLLQNGIRVPEDLAIVSFDNSDFATLSPVGITSLAHKKEELGRIAAQKLLSMIHGGKESPAVLPWELIERESTLFDR